MKKTISTALVGAFLLAFGAPLAVALDDHNPIGVTGAFEGVITTGCAYNVLNHNATRSPIDDIVVPGAVGKYGLKMSRYYNSRRTSSYLLMGPGWSHEYFWTSGNDTLVAAASDMQSASGNRAVAIALTRIRLHLAIYFWLHSGNHALKRCTMASRVSPSDPTNSELITH